MCARSHGATWRIGSEKIQPRHSTECSVSQSFDGSGDVFIYTRIWSKSCPGCEGYGRGIARSTDVSLATPRAHLTDRLARTLWFWGPQGGVSWDNATLRGLPDVAPDCEGSMASSLITKRGPNPPPSPAHHPSAAFVMHLP
eukprot:COSAG04_NODE_3253_length_3005_cov_3.655540_3_plen_141_part_00